MAGANGRMKKELLVALARKLLIALWRYVTNGVVPDGAVFAEAEARIVAHEAARAAQMRRHWTMETTGPGSSRGT